MGNKGKEMRLGIMENELERLDELKKDYDNFRNALQNKYSLTMRDFRFTIVPLNRFKIEILETNLEILINKNEFQEILSFFKRIEPYMEL